MAPPEEVAPAWHTGILLAYIAGISWMSLSSSAPPGHGDTTSISTTFPRPVIYATLLLSEWILFAIAYWGVRLRRVSVGSLLGYRWSGWSGFGRCLLLASACWVGTFGGVAQGLDALGLRQGDEIQRVADLVLPHGPLEIAIWTVVSATAGFVEEFVFRGYLQRQFGAWFRNPVAGIALSAIVFGAAHLYQGVASAAMILVVGLCFSIAAHVARSLVPGMLAHAFEDLFSGLAGRV